MLTSFHILNSVDSTNNYAMQRLNDGLAQSGEVYFALEQTAGRGQREKIWQSEPGMNIMMSFIFIPQTPFLLNSFQFSAKIALVVRTFIQNYVHAPVKIKWPNDLYINDRKAGGLLIENKYRGEQVKASVIGIGINVNQTDFGSQTKATSLKLNTIEILDPIEMARTLHEKLLESVTIIHQESPETLFGAYQSFLYKKNEITDFNIDGKLCRALVKGVDEQGFLLVEQDGQEMKFRSGEITWVS